MATVSELESRIAELKDARLSALTDSLENPKSTALAASIKEEIVKAEDSLELARLLVIATESKAEAARREAEAARTEEIKLQVAKLSADAVEAAERADAALAGLMSSLDAVQDAARQILKIDNGQQIGARRLLDASKLGRAVLGRRLPNGALVADYFAARRPMGFKPDESIRDFVEKFL